MFLSILLLKKIFYPTTKKKKLWKKNLFLMVHLNYLHGNMVIVLKQLKTNCIGMQTLCSCLVFILPWLKMSTPN